MSMITRFEDMQAWQEARKLVKRMAAFIPGASPQDVRTPIVKGFCS